MAEFKKPFTAEETKMGKSKVVDARGFSVATINSYHDKESAQLFAASPELLEACEMIDSLDPHNDSTTEWNGAFKMVRAAIAKAKGEM